MISDLFNIRTLHVRYVDEEGDTITVTTDTELQQAYREANETATVSLKFYIESDDLAEARSEAERQLQILAQSFVELGKSVHESMQCSRAADSLPTEALFEHASHAYKELKQHAKQHKGGRDHEGLAKLIEHIVRSETAAQLGLSCQDSPVWSGVTCCLCGMEPLTGIRYHCCECEGFDCCEECEASDLHIHPLVKMRGS
jgi:hypothetical protein